MPEHARDPSSLSRALWNYMPNDETCSRVTMAALLACSLACATAPMARQQEDTIAKRFEASPGSANLYVYRSSYLGSLVKFAVFVDGRLTGELPPSSFLFVTLEPGQHSVYVSSEDSTEQSFVAKAGKNHFLKITPRMGALSASAAASFRSSAMEEEARDEVRSCSLVRGIQPKQTKPAAR